MPNDTRRACVATDARDCIVIRYGHGEHGAHGFERDAERRECHCPSVPPCFAVISASPTPAP